SDRLLLVHGVHARLLAGTEAGTHLFCPVHGNVVPVRVEVLDRWPFAPADPFAFGQVLRTYAGGGSTIDLPTGLVASTAGGGEGVRPVPAAGPPRRLRAVPFPAALPPASPPGVMPPPPADRSLAHRLFVLALLLVFAAVSVQYSVKVLTPRKDGLTQSAILRWSRQIQDMEGGENIYATTNYPNPPIMPHMLWPVSELITRSPLAGALTWFYLKVGLALVCMVWAFRLVETPERPFPAWAKALAVVLAIRPILGDLSHGNVNIFILFLVMAALYAFSRGKGVASGLLLALGIACKVTPALFVVYFLWKRAWRVLVGCAAGLVLFFFLVPSLVFAVQEESITQGFERNGAALESWYRGRIEPYLVRGVVTPERENQSLPGLLTRLLTHSPSFSGWVDNIYTPLAYHNVADLGPGTVKRIVQLAQLLFLVLMVV